MLDGCIAGDDEKRSEVLNILSRTPQSLKATPPRYARRPNPKPAKHPALNPNSDQILSTPRPFIGGKKRMPIYATTNNIPFLRLGRKHPHNHAAYLRALIKFYFHRTELRVQLEEVETLAKLEDMWDIEMQTLAEPQVPPHFNYAASWSCTIRQGITYISDQLTRRQEKTADLAHRMQDLVARAKAEAAEEAEGAWGEDAIRGVQEAQDAELQAFILEEEQKSEGQQNQDGSDTEVQEIYRAFGSDQQEIDPESELRGFESDEPQENDVQHDEEVAEVEQERASKDDQRPAEGSEEPEVTQQEREREPVSQHR